MKMGNAITSKQTLQPQVESYRTAQTICCYVAFVAIGLAAGLLGPTLVGLAKQTESSFAEIGFVFTVHSLGYVIGSTVFGKFYDRVAGHRILAVMIVALSAALLLIPMSTQLWMLLCVALLLGTAEGTGQVGVNTLLVWLYNQKSTPFLNGAHFFFGVGALTSPIIVAQLLNNGYEFGAAYRFVAVLILPAILLFLLVPSPVVKSGEKSESNEPIKYGLVALVAAFYFLYLGTEISFGGWISTFAVSLNLGDEATAAYLASVFWSALTFGRLIAIPLSVKLKPRTLLIADLILALIGFAIIGFGGNSYAATLAGTLVIGVSFASIYPTMFSFAGNRLNVTGRVAGFFVMGGSFGSMLFPFLAGLMFERSGARSLIILNSIMVVSALAVLFVVLAAFPKKEQPAAR